MADECYRFQRRVGEAFAPLKKPYRPRQAQRTAMHQVVLADLESALAEVQAHSDYGTGYPHFVEQAFRSYLTCGDLSQGFARLRCQSCGHEKLLPFSCKSRICPSCHARRMHDTVFHLVDNVLPDAPYRQWVFTVPRHLRLILAKDKAMLREVTKILINTIFAWQRKNAKSDGFNDPIPAAIAFMQLFGGALNLNPHNHCLVPDGVFISAPEETLLFACQLEPSPKELDHMLRKLIRKGYSDDLDDNLDDDAHAAALAAALAEAIPNSQLWTPDQQDPVPDNRYCVQLDGERSSTPFLRNGDQS